MKARLAAALFIGLLLGAPARAEHVAVAVAANFAAVAEDLAPLFRAETGHEVTFSFGATGLLFAQISQGAPFEVLLAGDDVRPHQAVMAGLGVEESVFTYAIGALTLYSTTLELTDGPAVLQQDGIGKIAIADPETAPYGRAAMEALSALGLLDQVMPRLVTGENISQTLQFIETGNAGLGFVAASQVLYRVNVWLVPDDLHAPIRQDAVLLVTGADNPAALAFMQFLGGKTARQVIEAAGYRAMSGTRDGP